MKAPTQHTPARTQATPSCSSCRPPARVSTLLLPEGGRAGSRPACQAAAFPRQSSFVSVGAIYGLTQVPQGSGTCWEKQDQMTRFHLPHGGRFYFLFFFSKSLHHPSLLFLLLLVLLLFLLLQASALPKHVPGSASHRRSEERFDSLAFIKEKSL